MTWIQTFSGKKFDFAAPTPDMIDIETIAHCLASKQRFGDHLLFPYSVAEHSLRVAKCCSTTWKLEALMHDAAEAYTGDIVRPLKLMLPEIRYIESRIMAVIESKFELDYSGAARGEIKHWDNVLLSTEARDLFANKPVDDFHLQYGEPLAERIVPASDDVRRQFLQEFQLLDFYRKRRP
jgi:5'-deoxynucleotidase YfbR-like HD superfamily hydrolase